MGAEGQAAIEAGGLVVEVLHSGEPLPWIQAEDLHVTVVKVKDGETLQELQSREWSYIVDLKTMKIVWTGFGSYSGQNPQSFHDALVKLHEFLAAAP
jgi:hypothetical protein